MLDIQLGRRNLTPIQRIAVAERYRPIYEKQTQDNLREGGRKGGLSSSNKPTPKSVEAYKQTNRTENETNTKLARIANVGKETYRQAKRVLDSDNEDVKQRVLSREISISAGYRDLIESNLRQRVLGNTNPVKLGRCFDFLNNYYGFQHGGDRKSSAKVFNLINNEMPSTQKELAESYGISHQTMNNYIRMANMIPELEDLVDTGIVIPECAAYLFPILWCAYDF